MLTWFFLTLTRVGTVERSFWSPSRGPTSTSVTDLGHLFVALCMPRHPRFAYVRRCGETPNRRLQRGIMLWPEMRVLGLDHRPVLSAAPRAAASKRGHQPGRNQLFGGVRCLRTVPPIPPGCDAAGVLCLLYPYAWCDRNSVDWVEGTTSRREEDLLFPLGPDKVEVVQNSRTSRRCSDASGSEQRTPVRWLHVPPAGCSVIEQGPACHNGTAGYRAAALTVYPSSQAPSENGVGGGGGGGAQRS